MVQALIGVNFTVKPVKFRGFYPESDFAVALLFTALSIQEIAFSVLVYLQHSTFDLLLT